MLVRHAAKTHSDHLIKLPLHNERQYRCLAEINSLKKIEENRTVRYTLLTSWSKTRSEICISASERARDLQWFTTCARTSSGDINRWIFAASATKAALQHSMWPLTDCCQLTQRPIKARTVLRNASYDAGSTPTASRPLCKTRSRSRQGNGSAREALVHTFQRRDHFTAILGLNVSLSGIGIGNVRVAIPNSTL